MSANYVDLRLSVRTPAVGVLQRLLNRGGASIAVDGEFGPQTRKAVIAFQKAHRLDSDGIVGKDTWPRVSTDAGLKIIDFIDVFDKSLYDLEASDIAKLGGHPLLLGGACNGVDQAVGMITSAAPPGSVFLLRFHGHGNKGVAGVSFGHGDIGWGERADIDSANFNELQPVLSRLRPIFGPYGNIQFMHCSTGGGAAGRTLLNSIAQTIGVPATAAVFDQLGGGTTTFQYEGPTYTACPNSRSLREWCRSTPEFAGMCVA